MRSRLSICRAYLIGMSLLVAAITTPDVTSAQERRRSRSAETIASELTEAEVLLLYGFGDDETQTKAIQNFLAERAAVAKFLRRRRVVATDEAIERRLDDVRRVLATRNRTLDQALQDSGFDEATLRRALAVPIAWNEYLRLTLTEEAIQKEFDTHRSRYDGTRVRIKQIFFAADDSSEEEAARRNTANALRDKIAAGLIPFEDAAAQGGDQDETDVGWIRYRGDVPHVVAAWAFEATSGDVSPVLSSPFGSHVVMLIEKAPGEGSLEDARSGVIKALSDRLWAEALRESRPR